MTMDVWEPDEDPIDPPIKLRTLNVFSGIGAGFVTVYFLLHFFL